MSAIDEGIVREYFEQAGFFVRQARKYTLGAKRGVGEEVIDLLVFNPGWQRGSRKPDFFLFPNELPFVQRAVVSIKGWHAAGRFTPSTLRNQPEIFRFLEQNVLKEASRFFPETNEETKETLTKILVLPGLPTAEPFRSQAVAMLKEAGVDAVISFRAMLLDLIERVELNRNYGKSDTLQLIRILKNYDLLVDPQMDLLPTKRPRGND
ncbi:hypothetical protein ESB00_03240 [Oleiharenicola lentus]|uniref:Uncharacterized protein n=1 Tax=Oleiharenicola lentus TaxID=2508720 RepID=A0A4Q1C7M8_9BACT|nr:hypothetical protein [Oleiharenicola lentus]RXK54925.1 hypothetical protein ESB00_03240 [Oleiharenicola lentus]